MIVFRLSLLVIWACSLAASEPGDMVEVHPRELTNAVLHNPGMGWVLYENYPIDQDPHGSSTMVTLPGERFPEVDEVALMFSWQDIEIQQGRYDFSKVDQAYDYWRERGKHIQLRLSAESLVWWSSRKPPAGNGIPDYVLARLSPAEKQTRNIEGAPYVVVDARNSFYRKRLAAFLRKIRAHFNENHPVTLIDLRGFGVWGEWHSGFKYPSLSERRAALEGVVDIWSRNLPNHALALSYSYDPDGPKELYAGPNNRFAAEYTTNYLQFLQYSAFDHALKIPNVTWRRDGCGGAVHSNERQLNDEAFQKFGRAPMACEFLGGYETVKKGGTNWVNWMIEDALSLHPNYINLLGWLGSDALAFIKEQPDLVERGSRAMGYRLVPQRVRYQAEISRRKPVEIEFEWINRGVGRPLKDFELTLILVNPKTGLRITSSPKALQTSEWIAGKTFRLKYQARFGKAWTGPALLAFTLSEPRSGRKIALPIETHDTGSVYPVGPLVLTEN